MRNLVWAPMFSVLGVTVLVASCAEDTSNSDHEAEESALDAVPEGSAKEADFRSETHPDREHRPSQQIIAGESGVEIRHLSGEEGAGVEVHHLHCEDDEALAQKADHNGESQPEGWPQDWDGSGAMPDPYCHPDYLEIGEWEHLETHSACWEGTETSTLGDQGQPQEEIDTALWEQSQARADWEPNPPGGTCAEQWAEHDGGDPEDYADIGNANDG